jgi:hypothetical protein
MRRTLLVVSAAGTQIALLVGYAYYIITVREQATQLDRLAADLKKMEQQQESLHRFASHMQTTVATQTGPTVSESAREATETEPTQNALKGALLSDINTLDPYQEAAHDFERAQPAPRSTWVQEASSKVRTEIGRHPVLAESLKSFECRKDVCEARLASSDSVNTFQLLAAARRLDWNGSMTAFPEADDAGARLILKREDPETSGAEPIQ